MGHIEPACIHLNWSKQYLFIYIYYSVCVNYIWGTVQRICLVEKVSFDSWWERMETPSTKSTYHCQVATIALLDFDRGFAPVDEAAASILWEKERGLQLEPGFGSQLFWWRTLQLVNLNV